MMHRDTVFLSGYLLFVLFLLTLALFAKRREDEYQASRDDNLVRRATINAITHKDLTAEYERVNAELRAAIFEMRAENAALSNLLTNGAKR